MALHKFALLPSKPGYSVGDSADAVLRAKVGAGPSRQRLDFPRAPHQVTVSFSLDSAQYDYWRAFWSTGIEYGSLPFLIDLIIDAEDLAEYEAKFVPGSVSLSDVSGLRYQVDAILEVKPNVRDREYDETLVMLYDIYGEDVPIILNMLEKLVNVDLPNAIPG